MDTCPKFRPLQNMLICLLCAATLNACPAPTQNIYEKKAWNQETQSKDASYVFGRIQWLVHGKEKKMQAAFGAHLAHILLRMEDRKRFRIETSKSGEFIWTLEPGIYVIARLNYWDMWAGNYFIVPKVAFRVPAKRESITSEPSKPTSHLREIFSAAYLARRSKS